MQEQKLEYAGFWIRTWATVIDSFLVILITFPLLIAIYGWEYFDADKTGLIAGPADFLISWVIPAVAVTLFWIARQATPGKMAISAKIVDAATGQAPTTAQFIGRYLAYFVSLLPLGLGYLWVAFDRKKQGWHDKMAGTVVVREARRSSRPAHFGQA